MSRSRAWCFTWNNYDNDSFASLCELGPTYVICGYEIGESGTEHIQGFIYFKNGKSFNSLSSSIQEAHWEQARNIEASINYCKKDNNYEDYGTPPSQGKRTDLLNMIHDIEDTGLNNAILLNPAVFIKYPRGITEYSRILQSDLVGSIRQRKVYWFFGPTGCGKTFAAISKSKGTRVWIHAGNPNWFDGYDGQSVAIFDDFRYDAGWRYNDILRYTDERRILVPIKGSHTLWEPTKIIFTTPFSVDRTFESVNENLDQLFRRIHKIKQFTVPYNPETNKDLNAL